MVVWRLTLKQHAAADGEGARRYGGRWNKPGTPVVYTSGTLSLAALEYLVHVDSDILPDGLVSISATIPDRLKIETIDASRLPGEWRDKIIPPSVQQLGTDWATNAKSAVLKVPSVIIEHEWNYVLNPRHPEFSQITWQAAAKFSFDSRFFT